MDERFDRIAQLTALCIDCTYKDDWQTYIEAICGSEDELGGLGPVAILSGMIRAVGVLNAPETATGFAGAFVQFQDSDGKVIEPEESGAPRGAVMAARFMAAASNRDGDQMNAIWNVMPIEAVHELVGQVYMLCQQATWKTPDWQDPEIWKRAKERGL